MGGGEDTTVAQTAMDVAVVGAGAAGLFTAITAAEMAPGLSIACLDGARTIGAKILVSGGSRCNVTNAEVTERDFHGGSPHIIRRVLRAFPAAMAAEWFRQAGVALHEEDRGRLFPDSNRARTVLEALLRQAARHGVAVRPGHRVTGTRPTVGGFRLETSQGPLAARVVVLATGGQSLPKSGSDGFGYELARQLGHSLVEPVPALVPLVVRAEVCAVLSGVSHDAAFTCTAGGVKTVVRGPLLWTHTGISGPAALDLSRHWLRATAAGQVPEVRLSVLPGVTIDALDARLATAVRATPRGTLRSALAGGAPAAVLDAFLRHAGLEPSLPLAHLTREARRAAVRALLEWPVPITGSRGYQYAEVTAGGVPLAEIDAATMASRRCQGLFLAGEILDVDGRLGGFNFQWAWSSGRVAGLGIARRLGDGGGRAAPVTDREP